MQTTERDDAVNRRGIYGRLHVDRLIGEGGVALVYLANDIHTGKPFAVKILRNEMAKNAMVRARFRKEGKLARKLRYALRPIQIHLIRFLHACLLRAGGVASARVETGSKATLVHRTAVPLQESTSMF